MEESIATRKLDRRKLHGFINYIDDLTLLRETLVQVYDWLEWIVDLDITTNLVFSVKWQATFHSLSSF